ncbi:MAG: hypothetical protein AB7K68_02750 [Bacteriovoracia bacterium]
MKLLGWSLGFFCAFFALGWILSTESPPVSAPLSPQLQDSSAPVAVPPPSPGKTAEVLLRGHGAELFSALFDAQILGSQRFADLEPILSARFRRSYPRDERGFQLELVSRMGILKALSSAYGERMGEAERAALFAFYRGLALRPRENMLVRRQALKNLTAWIKTLPEKKRGDLISRLPASIVASAPFSERELVEGIFSDAE